jgi:predicted dehydrogenase
VIEFLAIDYCPTRKEETPVINAAIVGLGRWGQNLVNSVQGKSDKIRFVAGVLRHPEKARDYAARQGFPLYDRLEAVLAEPKIDAVVLATPHTAHAKQIVAAANAGKHVFTEKPFTLTRADAVRALRACADNDVTLAVGFNWRFQPALQEIRRMLQDGRLGRLLHIEGNFCGPSTYRFGRDHWRQNREEGPAGGMTGRGVHVVDAMLYLAGRIDSVHAQSERLAQDFGIDDTTSMLFKFESGATAYLGTVIATAETWRMQVFGSRGWVEVGDVEHLTTWQMKVCYVDPDDLHTHHRPQLVSFPETSTERAELEHFADAARAGRPLAVPGGDEEHGVAVLEAILESAKTRSTVRIGARPAAKKQVASQPAAGRPAAKKKKAAKPMRKAARKK